MNNKSIIGTLVSAALLAFAAWSQAADSVGPGAALQLAQAAPAKAGKVRKKPNQVCTHQNKCEVTITATACSKDGIKADPENLGIHARNKNVNIHWTIKTPGYTFKKDKEGIVFKESNPEFDDPKWISDTEYRWRDKNIGTESWDYGIRIFKGAQECLLDPSIINGAS
jgi:hypothetical protein